MKRIVKVLTGWGATERAAKLLAPFVLGLAVLALLGALWGAWELFDWWDDRQAIQRDRAAANAEFRGKQIEAERAAGGNKTARDRAEDDRQRDLQEELDDAEAAGDSGADDVWNGGLWD